MKENRLRQGNNIQTYLPRINRTRADSRPPSAVVRVIRIIAPSPRNKAVASEKINQLWKPLLA